MMSGFSCAKLGLALTIQLVIAGAAYAGDISVVSEIATRSADFNNPAIPVTEALIVQSGNSDFASVDQQGGAVGAGNYSEIDQTGSFNRAIVSQNGDSNRSRINQSGSSNYANITQSGSGNSIDLAQTGDANLTATQIGDYNSILGNLTNQNSMPATLSEIGNNNLINVNLSSPGLIVNISIVGNGMSVTRTN